MRHPAALSPPYGFIHASLACASTQYQTSPAPSPDAAHPARRVYLPVAQHPQPAVAAGLHPDPRHDRSAMVMRPIEYLRVQRRRGMPPTPYSATRKGPRNVGADPPEKQRPYARAQSILNARQSSQAPRNDGGPRWSGGGGGDRGRRDGSHAAWIIVYWCTLRGNSHLSLRSKRVQIHLRPYTARIRSTWLSTRAPDAIFEIPQYAPSFQRCANGAPRQTF